MQYNLYMLFFAILILLPAGAKDQGVKGIVYIHDDVPIRIEDASVVLRHGPLWQDTVQTDSNGCFCFKTPYNGDHHIRVFKNFGDEKDPDIWECGWRFLVVHREKYTTVWIYLERQ